MSIIVVLIVDCAILPLCLKVWFQQRDDVQLSATCPAPAGQSKHRRHSSVILIGRIGSVYNISMRSFEYKIDYFKIMLMSNIIYNSIKNDKNTEQSLKLV